MTSYLIHQLLEMQIQALPFMMTLLCDLFGIYIYTKSIICVFHKPMKMRVSALM